MTHGEPNWMQATAEGGILSAEEYKTLFAATHKSGATREQAAALIRKFEEAQVAQLLLEMLVAGEVVINGWKETEALYTTHKTSIDLSQFSRN